MKHRITVSENNVALILPRKIADDVKAMCFLIRKGRKYSTQDKNAMQEIAGDLLLAVIEAEERTYG